jgi:hypothetical protein
MRIRLALQFLSFPLATILTARPDCAEDRLPFSRQDAVKTQSAASSNTERQ